MALLNRKLKEKAPEDLPLLEEPEKVVVDLEEDEEEKEVFVHHGITLWVSDAVLLTVEHFQIFALILAMSERWGFPLSFIKASYYVFLVNIDIWEFIKVYSGAYSGFTNKYVASASIPISYQYYLIAWTIFIAFVCFGFLATYAGFLRKKPLYLLLHVARMKRVFCVLAQLLCFPVGIVFARTFHCRYNEKQQLIWNVANELQCWTMPHYVYVAIALLVTFLLFVCYPINIIRKIKGQVVSYHQGKHEGYLQLKEAEYNQGLDILWAVGQFHLFSSFKRMWVYYRPIMFCLKLTLICFFGLQSHFESILSESLVTRLTVTVPIIAVFIIIVFLSVSSSASKPPVTACRSFMIWFLRRVLTEIFNIFFSVRINMLALKPVVVILAFGVYNCQHAGGALGSLFCIIALVMIRSFPFRVTSFNVMIIMSLLYNTGNAYIGFLLEQFKNSMIQSSLLAEPYPTYALIFNSAWWLSFVFFWWMYLFLRYYQIVGRGRPLWPMLSTDGKGKMGDETKKYLRAVLHGRHILERALTSPPIFSPVHELERQIHIINAYCREAEYMDDPTFDSLWDLLDELIEAHKMLAPKSLFSQSVKKTIRETAKEFLKMMPAMRRRLDRRDYDFILMTPLKRRLLLKMFVLGTFVNGRSSRLCNEIETKVHMDLEKAALKSSSTDLANSSISCVDSSADQKYMYATTDTIGTLSSASSSNQYGRFSIDQLLYEATTLEEGLANGREKMKQKKSLSSLPGSSCSSLSLPGQITDDERNEYPPSYSSGGYSSETDAAGAIVTSSDDKPDNVTNSDNQPGYRSDNSGSRTSLKSVEGSGFYGNVPGTSRVGPTHADLQPTVTSPETSGYGMRGSSSSLRSLDSSGPIVGLSGQRPNSKSLVRSQSSSSSQRSTPGISSLVQRPALKVAVLSHGATSPHGSSPDSSSSNEGVGRPSSNSSVRSHSSSSSQGSTPGISSTVEKPDPVVSVSSQGASSSGDSTPDSSSSNEGVGRPNSRSSMRSQDNSSS